ncbi:hypothetical protein [Methanobacterium sp. BAmetb5]|uniref:hypothetical protein n=1 Tax=Methanobacterium sp. BAmetb5 TaxID=2025351 RepID=UPI000E7DCAF0|nr:hypothetical protein [Methanobacterium sp. BAmetb5]AXV40390.1 MAG: hypothetical protein CIT02_08690 [Methanobacterium sp. BAmetb5]
MENNVILAKINFFMDLSDETKIWLCDLEKNNPCFRNEIDLDYFSFNKEKWKIIFVNSSQQIIDEFFLDLGLSKEYLPKIEVQDYYSGSFVINADIIISSGLTLLFNSIHGFSGVPQIYEGLKGLKTKWNESIRDIISKEVYQDLKNTYNQRPPRVTVDTKIAIDTRPLLDLNERDMRSQSAQINVGLSRHSFKLENLSEETISHLRVGLLIGFSKEKLCEFENSYQNGINNLFAHKSITINLCDFLDKNGNSFDLPREPVYIVCWVEEGNGIYFFQFYLDY